MDIVLSHASICGTGQYGQRNQDESQCMGANSMTSGSGSSQLPFETVQHGTGRKKSQSLFTIFQGLVHEPLPDIQPHEILVGLLLAPRRVIFARYFLYRQRDGFQKIFFSCFSSTICLRSEKVSDAACIICPYGSPDPVPEPKMAFLDISMARDAASIPENCN